MSLKPFHNLCFLILWLILWEVLSRLVIRDSNILPPATQVITRFYEHICTGNRIISDVLSSLRRYFLAFLLSFPLSIFLAYFVSQSRMIGGFINFFFSSTYSLPKVALYPFILIAFGIGDLSKIVLIALGMFYIFYFNTYQGIQQLECSSYYDVIQIFKVNWKQRLWNFYIKGCLPFLMTGLKTGLGYGLVLVVVCEMSFSSDGIGLFIWNAWDQFRLIDMFVGVFFLIIASGIVFLICDGIESKLRKKGLLYR